MNIHDDQAVLPKRFITTCSILFSIIVVWTGCTSKTIPRYSLPDFKAANSIHANFVYDRENWEEVKFEIPKEHWAKIFFQLSPSEYDPHPANWQQIGSLKLKGMDGLVTEIWLYDTYKDQGAFSVGPDIEHRSYYRGGDSVKLESALRAAYKDWKKSKSREEKVTATKYRENRLNARGV